MPNNPHVLNALKAGITRLRTKGGASPDSLYDLVNGYVTTQRTIQIRPGTIIDADLGLFSGTRGLCAFKGKLVFFSKVPVAAPSAKYENAVLMHPTDPAANLARILFAGPYVGALYVVAEWSNGDIFHYWLESTREWAQNTVFLAAQNILPTVHNGLAYQATRLGNAYPAWAPGVPRAVGDKIEPTVYNGYYYEVTAVDGASPASGTSEPVWPIADGALVFEQADGGAGNVGGGSPVETAPPEPGAPAPGEGDGELYCIWEEAWMSPTMQAKDFTAGMLADLHTPELGYFRGPCIGMKRALVPCVRIVTESGAKTVSRTTPVNHYEALADLSPQGTWDFAPLLRPGTLIRVGFGPERVVAVEDAGKLWVRKLSFGGASYAGSDARLGARIYTHNARIVK